MCIDRIILSTDENETYIQFWFLVSTAWKKFFPEVIVTLAFLTDRKEDDALVQEMRKYGDVHLIKPIEGFPKANQAKMSRHILASRFEDEVCCLHDIDSCPLQREYTERFVSERREGTVLRVGKEVFFGTPHEGKFPMSHITAEGHVWKEVINPDNLSDEELFRSWGSIHVFDVKEALSKPADVFSDESLLRVLLTRWGKGFTDVERNVDVYKYWIDRSFWDIDLDRLYNNDYVEVNLLRPFQNHWEDLKPVVQYICGHAEESIILKMLDYD